ncbi:hypothetical protein MHB42_09800 [Lysinibacillus sp. FSL K6-0232]|uniref:hypothetical protein n=1 Tax=Lysinibacillus sp. FSL K6-0232 TaxID=2921425 RepID=UPI0030F4F554
MNEQYVVTYHDLQIGKERIHYFDSKEEAKDFFENIITDDNCISEFLMTKEEYERVLDFIEMDDSEEDDVEGDYEAAKFEKYDRVELNADLDDLDLLEGESGMIMSGLLKNGCYAVSFDFDDVDEDTLHDCNGLVPNGKGLYIAEEYLRKI